VSRAQIGKADVLDPLLQELEEWWTRENQDWDAVVNDAAASDGDLWNGLPEVDSKAIARSSPIFEKHLGVPLDVKLIRRGGYTDFREMANELVPRMRQLAGNAT